MVASACCEGALHSQEQYPLSFISSCTVRGLFPCYIQEGGVPSSNTKPKEFCRELWMDPGECATHVTWLTGPGLGEANYLGAASAVKFWGPPIQTVFSGSDSVPIRVKGSTNVEKGQHE